MLIVSSTRGLLAVSSTRGSAEAHVSFCVATNLHSMGFQFDDSPHPSVVHDGELSREHGVCQGSATSSELIHAQLYRVH